MDIKLIFTKLILAMGRIKSTLRMIILKIRKHVIIMNNKNMDVNDIKNFYVDLIPLPKDDDGYLGEVDDYTSIKPLFEVTYSNLDENNGITNGKFRIKATTSISDLKSLSEGFRTAVFDVKNKDVSWDEATDFKYNSNGYGLCFRKSENKKCWISDRQIAITLIRQEKKKFVKGPEKLVEEGNNHKASPKNTIINHIGSDIISSNNIIEKKSQEDTLKNIKISPEIKTKSENENLNLSQYLMSGREGESFFYEGSQSDRTGASFRVDYDSMSMKGEYDIIIDINNLRAINPGFRREVVKIINNGTTLRSALDMITVEKGSMHFSKNDGVWFVDKSVVIKLLK